MSELRDIIAAFLAALTRAQHDANLLSKKLSERYRHDRLLRYYPVPNALLDDVEAELRFAVVDGDAGAPDGETGTPGGQTLVERQTAVAPALAAARAVLAELARDIPAETGDVPLRELRQHLTATANAERLARRFSAPVRGLLQARVDGLLELPSMSAREADAQLRASIEGMLRAELDATPQLAERSPSGPLVDRLVGLAWQALDAPIAQLARRLADEVRGDGPLPSDLKVDLVTSNTSQFPDYALHTLKLHARLRNYKWVIVDKDTDQEELLPTD